MMRDFLVSTGSTRSNHTVVIALSTGLRAHIGTLSTGGPGVVHKVVDDRLSPRKSRPHTGCRGRRDGL